MAHRKQIQVKKQKQEARKQTVTFESVQNDKSEKKEMSHSLMRGLILGKLDVLTDMKKNEVLKLCLAYNVKVPSKARKSEVTDKLSQAILSSMEMGNPGALYEEPHTSHREVQTQETSINEPQATGSDVITAMHETTDPEPSVSDIETAVVDAEPSTSAVHDIPESMETDDYADSDLCIKCNKTGKPGVQWIQCSSCSGWLHRNCSGLRAKKAWAKFSKTGSEFFCSECK